MVFSSTAAVYGVPDSTPIREDAPLRPINPYGETKRSFEGALAWYGRAYGVRSVTLRYFNVAGATDALGEDHDPETHLIPTILRSVEQRRPVTIFGADYPTPDGTCIRDYIHVADLADAHLRAIDATARGDSRTSGGAVICNLGNGGGFSNREVLAAAERVVGRRHPPRGRASAGPAIRLSWSPQRIEPREILGWRPTPPVDRRHGRFGVGVAPGPQRWVSGLTRPTTMTTMAADDAIQLARDLRLQWFGKASSDRIAEPVVEPLWSGLRVVAAAQDGKGVLLEDGAEVTTHPHLAEGLAKTVAATASGVILDAYVTKQVASEEPGVGVYTGVTELPTAGNMLMGSLVGRGRRPRRRSLPKSSTPSSRSSGSTRTSRSTWSPSTSSGSTGTGSSKPRSWSASASSRPSSRATPSSDPACTSARRSSAGSALGVPRASAASRSRARTPATGPAKWPPTGRRGPCPAAEAASGGARAAPARRTRAYARARHPPRARWYGGADARDCPDSGRAGPDRPTRRSRHHGRHPQLQERSDDRLRGSRCAGRPRPVLPGAAARASSTRTRARPTAPAAS